MIMGNGHNGPYLLNRQTDTSEKITFMQLSGREVNVQYLISTPTLRPGSLFKFANRRQSINFSMLLFNVKRSETDYLSKSRRISVKYEPRIAQGLSIGIIYTKPNRKRT